MNIDDLVKLIPLLSSDDKQSDDKNIFDGLVGAYVICRSRNEGVNAGYVDRIDGTGVVLRECRRLWSHKPKDANLSWYEGVAISGLSRDSKASCRCTKVIVEDYSITICSDEARVSIEQFDDYKGS